MTSSEYYEDHTWKPLGAGDSALRYATLAYGLSDEQREWMEALVEEYEKHQPHNAMLRDYYDGRVRVDDYGIGSAIRNDQTCHWPAQAVQSLASRVHLERFTCEDGDALECLEESDRHSNIVGGYNAYLASKYLYGCMCATVNLSGGLPTVTYHTAETFTAIPDGGRVTGGRVAAGLAIARFERPYWDRSRAVPTVLHLHLPNNTVEIVQKAKDEWVAEQGPHAHEHPMMRVFSHERVGSVSPFGRTRINSFVRSLTDDAIRCLWHMQVSGAFYSMAKMFITGLTDDQFDAMVKNKTGYQLDRLLLLTMGADQDSAPNVGQLSGNSPQPFIDELRSLAAQFSGATGVPLNSLGIVQDNPSSAEAIQAAREDICLIARRDIEDDRVVLEDMAQMIVEMVHPTPTAPILAKFSNPLLTSMSAQADWALKVNSIRPTFGQTDVAARLMGFDDADLAEMRADEERAEAGDLIRSMLSGEGGGSGVGGDA